MSHHDTYFVALYGGFLVEEMYENEDGNWIKKYYTIGDARQATTWFTFQAADTVAKMATNKLYPPDLRYFAILVPPKGDER